MPWTRKYILFQYHGARLLLHDYYVITILSLYCYYIITILLLYYYYIIISRLLSTTILRIHVIRSVPVTPPVPGSDHLCSHYHTETPCEQLNHGSDSQTTILTIITRILIIAIIITMIAIIVTIITRIMTIITRMIITLIIVVIYKE